MKLTLLFPLLILAEMLSAQTFTESLATPFIGVESGSTAFADVDGDGDQDIFMTGRDYYGTRIGRLYTNDGVGNFTEMMETPFEGIVGSIGFSDIDGDNDPDLLITGRDTDWDEVTKLYKNDGLGNFTEVTGSPFDSSNSGTTLAFGDIDGDSFEEVLIMSVTNSFVKEINIYKNDGAGNFTEMTDTPFSGVSSGTITFDDVDGDNDQDVLITGVNDYTETAKLYKNDGLGNFTEVMGTSFERVKNSAVAFEDIDGDNDNDVLITGEDSLNNPIAKLYINDGIGNFTEMADNPFSGVAYGSIAFADIDGDSDKDVLITGEDSLNNSSTKLYTNDGIGNFMEEMEMPFERVQSSAIAFADVDGDNDQDVLITGEISWTNNISKLYINESAVVSANDDLSNANDFEFTLSPNPVTEKNVYVNFDAVESSELSVKISSVQGFSFIQQNKWAAIGQQNFSVDISSLKKGIYFMELNDGKKRGITKFIIQ